MNGALRHPSTWLAASSLGALGVLLSGNASLLETDLPGGLPFGNLLCVLVPLCAGLAGFFYSRRGSLLRLLSIVTAMLAIGWLPITLATSGNLRANFGGDDAAYALWLRYTAIAGVLALVSLLTTLVRAIVDARRAGRD